MNKRLLRLLIMGGSVVFFTVAILTFIAYQRKPVKLAATAMPTQEQKEDAAPGTDITVSCFFFSEDSSQMQSVSRRLKADDRQDRVYKAFLDLIIKGEPGAVLPLPAGTQIRSFYYLSEEKRLILDFEAGLEKRILQGSSAELSFIYFFVNNLCFNFKEIESVQFLIGGNEHETLAGHIVFDEPFYPDYSYLSGGDEQ